MTALLNAAEINKAKGLICNMTCFRQDIKILMNPSV